MLRSTFFTVAYLLLFQALPAQTNYWQKANAPQGISGSYWPGQGDTSFLMHSLGTVYRSDNRGSSWQELMLWTNNYNELFPGEGGHLFYTVTVANGTSTDNYLYKTGYDAQNPDLVHTNCPVYKMKERNDGLLIGASSSGIYRSADGGATWMEVYDIPFPGSSLEINFWADGVVSFQPNIDVTYLSFDDGLSWITVNASVFNGKLTRASDGVLYMTGLNTIKKSVDQGATWQVATTGLSFNLNTNSLTELPNGRLLLASSNRTQFYSDNQGQNWFALTPSSADRPKNYLKVYDDGLILASNTNNVLRSTDGGISWSLSDTGTNEATVSHLSFYNDSLRYATTPSGMWRSLDAGDTWSRVVADTVPSQYYPRELFAVWHPDTFAVMQADKLLRTFDGGLTFADVTPLSGLNRGNLFISPSSNRIFATIQNNVVYSVNYGDTWQLALNSEIMNSMDETPDGRLFLYSYNTNHKLWTSTDGGTTWAEVVNLDWNNVAFADMDVAPDGTVNVLMVKNSSMVLASSNDAGNSWLYHRLPSNNIFQPDITTNAAGHLLIPAINNMVFVSTDAGLSWYNLPTMYGTLGQPLLFVDPQGYLYGYTTSGLQRSTTSSQEGGYLRGFVFKDADADCSTPDAQNGLKNWKLTIDGSQGTFYASTAVDGSYQLFVDTGAYNIQVLTPQSFWWAMCDSLQSAVIDTFLAIDTTDFSVVALVDCPIMSVDVTAPRLRRCFNNTIYVQTCNVGTETADSAWVDVFLDPNLTLVSSAQPHDSVGLNSWRFFVGDVVSGDCVQFNLTAYVNCDSTVLGQTHCVSAHAFPDTLCAPVPNWSGANLEARVSCLDTIVHFELENTGTAPSQPLDYIIIVDDVVLMQGEEMYEINEILNLEQPANGQTWRIESQQEPGHPFSTVALAFTEGCGGFGSLGFINQFSLNGVTPSMDRFCLENTGSYDPNDK
ncbi:MAG: hypothetical protein IT270_21225, partial [Saprospiraceae bacterium]|nr:hypothetical protein [Saprospiraceae bacterium]